MQPMCHGGVVFAVWTQKQETLQSWQSVASSEVTVLDGRPMKNGMF